MEYLIDCDVLDYCHTPEDERHIHIQEIIEGPVQPTYALPVFELHRAVHLLVKYHQTAPADFRHSWANFSSTYWDDGIGWLHISAYPDENENLPREILRLPYTFDVETDVPCEGTPDRYWDNYRMLTQRLRCLCQSEPPDEDYSWVRLASPEGHIQPIESARSDSEDVVLDTNNLIELLNQLPETGYGINIKTLRFPRRLAEKATRHFRRILETYGRAGKFIVPLSALEETARVINYPYNHQKYAPARAVLRGISLAPDTPLWNSFSFKPLTQEIFDSFLQLYENLYLHHNHSLALPGFGDALILAYGIYHHCFIASNEWFEKPEWDAIAQMYPYLVLKDS